MLIGAKFLRRTVSFLIGNMNMNAALLYRPRGRWLFCIAFASAVAIHLGAIVIANGKSNKIAMEDFKPAGIDVQVVNSDPEGMPPEQQELPPPAEPIVPDKEAFTQEEARVPTFRPPRKTRAASHVRTAVRGTAAQFGSVKALVMYAPHPVYPYEARRQRMTGSGIALLTVAPAGGSVINVRMAQSSGSVILDNATLDALRRWRFKPGSVENIQVPITYTLTGASY
jgi:TonB family protein